MAFLLFNGIDSLVCRIITFFSKQQQNKTRFFLIFYLSSYQNRVFTVRSFDLLCFCHFWHFLTNIAQIDLLCLITLCCSCKHTYAQHGLASYDKRCSHYTIQTKLVYLIRNMDTSDDVIVEAFDDLGYILEDPKVIEKLKLFCHQYELNVIELSQQYLKFALKNKCDDPKSEGTLALSHSSF